MPHRRITAALSIAFFLGFSSLARADGKFYARERVPPGVPYQRAILMYDDGRETLILQSKFSASGQPEPGAALGWVVPVPSVPELGSMKAEHAYEVFFNLGMSSRPTVTSIPVTLLSAIVLSLALLMLLSQKRRPSVIEMAGILLFPFVIVAILTPGLAGIHGIDVLHEQDIGLYQAKVIKAGDSSALLAWLNEGGFQFADSDRPVLDNYIRKGWCFVVAQVRPGEEKKALDTYEGLADPLILRFASKVPVYPLALTGTTGASTDVLLYALSRSKLDVRGVLALRFADVTESWSAVLDQVSRDSKASWQPLEWERNLTWLCKFKGTLTPAQMATDLEFAPAPDNAPYRERIVRWN
jgi:hypothetical protein